MNRIRPYGGDRRPLRLRSALVVMAVAAALASCSSPGHRKAITPPPPVTTTTTPAPQYQASPFSWDRVGETSVAVGGGSTATLSSLLLSGVGDPWNLFGTRYDDSGHPTATEWRSANGSTWSSSDLTTEGGYSQANGAASFRNATVVVGATGTGADLQATAWISQSGGSFTPASVPASSGPSVMDLVTGGALGFFATGTVDGRFALWESTNGQQWSEVSGAERVITSQPLARVNAVLSVGNTVYAAGSVQPGAVQQAAIWTSSDGLDWRQVQSASTSFSGVYGHVIYSLGTVGGGSAAGTGLVAVGAIDAGAGWEPASWISPNGISWSLPSTDFPGSPSAPSGSTDLGASGGTAALSVSEIPTLDGTTNLVAAGGGPYGQAVWRSSDGLHWTSMALPGPDRDAGTWTAGLIASTGSETVVADPDPGQPYLLAVPDGPFISATTNMWSQPSSNPTVFGAIRPEAVPVSLQNGPDGLDLTVEVVHRPQTIGPATVDIVRLASADGQTWSPASAADLIGTEPGDLPVPGAAAERVDGEWLAVSRQLDSVPVIYVSSDGRHWTESATLPAPFASASGGSATSGGSGSTTTTTTSGGVTLPALGEPGYSAAALCRIELNTGGSESNPTDTTGSGATPTSSTTAASTTTTTTPESTAIMAVGSGQFVSPGSPTATTGAAAWSLTSAGWSAASVSQSLVSGSGQRMAGCFSAGTTTYAYGAAAASSGSPAPALWKSTDGTSWSKVGVSAFGTGDPSPIASAAADGDYRLAVANPAPTADPFQAGVFGVAGPGAGLGSDVAFGSPASVQNGADSLWLSDDSDSGWAAVDVSDAPWLGAQQTDLDLTAFATGDTPVVVGSVDGELAVWVATLTSSGNDGGQPGSTSTSSTTE